MINTVEELKEVLRTKVNVYIRKLKEDHDGKLLVIEFGDLGMSDFMAGYIVNSDGNNISYVGIGEYTDFGKTIESLMHGLEEQLQTFDNWTDYDKTLDEWFTSWSFRHITEEQYEEEYN